MLELIVDHLNAVRGAAAGKRVDLCGRNPCSLSRDTRQTVNPGKAFRSSSTAACLTGGVIAQIQVRYIWLSGNPWLPARSQGSQKQATWYDHARNRCSAFIFLLWCLQTWNDARIIYPLWGIWQQNVISVWSCGFAQGAVGILDQEEWFCDKLPLNSGHRAHAVSAVSS